MKKLTLGSAAALLITTTTVAFAENEGSCLPVSVISSANFTHAYNTNDLASEWELTTNNFNYRGSNWNIIFVVKLPEVKNSQDALDTGKKLFQELSVSDPNGSYFGDQFFCSYDTHNDQFFLLAANPPLGSTEDIRSKLRLLVR